MAAEINHGFKEEECRSKIQQLSLGVVGKANPQDSRVMFRFEEEECRREIRKLSLGVVGKALKQPPFIMTTLTTDINYDDLVLQSRIDEEAEIESRKAVVVYERPNIDLDEAIPKNGGSSSEDKSCGQKCCVRLVMVFHGCGRIFLYGLYLYDMFTDVKVSLLFLERGHRWWGSLGLSFFGVSWIIQCALAYDKVTVGYVPTADNTLYYGRLSDRRVAKLLFPLLPLIQITWSTYELVFGKVNTSVAIHRKISAYRVKLIEVMFESFPQILLQSYVIMIYKSCNPSTKFDDDFKVTTLQWISLTNSLVSISVGLANGFMFQEIRKGQTLLLLGASWVPYKSAWLILAAITIGCRIYVCAMWGAVLGSLMLVIPLLTGLLISIGIWGLRAYFPCSYWVRAGLRFGDRGGTFEEKSHIVFSWMGTLLGNGCNGTGMILSLVYLLLAAIPFVIKWHLLSAIGFVIATVAAVANIIALVTSKGQDIGQRWVEGQFKVCKAGQKQWFNGRWRGAIEGEKYYSFRYY